MADVPRHAICVWLSGHRSIQPYPSGDYVLYRDHIAKVAALEAALAEANTKLQRGCLDCTTDPRRAQAAQLLAYATAQQAAGLAWKWRYGAQPDVVAQVCRLALGIEEPKPAPDFPLGCQELT